MTALLLPAAAFSETDVFAFRDIAENNVYGDAINYLHDQDYVEGYADGTFKAEDMVNRSEALKIILNATETELYSVGYNEAPLEFPDVEPSDWFYPYVETAYQLGIIHGHEDGFFRPNEGVNRMEAIKMLLRAKGEDCDQQEYCEEGDAWYSHYLNLGEEEALIVPDEDNNYLPYASMTRGELAELIYRYENNNPFTGETEYGKATYYGYSFNGSGTASGETLNTYGYMAAHKTLPFGTWVRITNLDNMQYVDVKIVDRGPYGPGRIIDLTPHAFDEIGALSTGVLRVRLEVLNTNE